MKKLSLTALFITALCFVVAYSQKKAPKAPEAASISILCLSAGNAVDADIVGCFQPKS
jgi:hypothetical protein